MDRAFIDGGMVKNIKECLFEAKELRKHLY